MHCGRIVDRPHVHLQAQPVGVARRTARSTTRTRPYRTGTWAATTDGGSAQPPPGQRRRAAAGPPPRCPARWPPAGPASGRSRASRASLNEASSTRSRGAGRAAPPSTVGRDRRVGLHVDVEPDLRPGGEHLVEPRHGRRPADPHRGQVGPAQVARSGPAGRRAGPAVVVVEDHRHAVGGGVHVGLQVAVAQRRRPARTPSAVFSSPSAAPPRWAKASGSGASRYGK